jgi:hypothetical protein
MTLNNSMSITPSPPGQAKGERFEHGQFSGEKPCCPGQFSVEINTLAKQTRATNGSGLFVRDDLVAQARHAGVWAQRIPQEFRAEERLLSVAGHVSSGMVRITAQVTEKAKTSPFAGALNLRVGEGTEDPLRCALVSAIALSLDNVDLAA